jgi:hypothetical protein
MKTERGTCPSEGSEKLRRKEGINKKLARNECKIKSQSIINIKA